MIENNVPDGFVPFQPSKELKELGFNEPCIAKFVRKQFSMNVAGEWYRHNSNEITTGWISAPLYQQVFKWFREKHNLRGFIGFRPNVKKFDYHIYDMSLSGMEYVKQRTMTEYNKDPLVGTYEDAELACLNKLIEIIKQK